MDNQILDKLSRFLLLPSSVSCHFRNATDVIENSIIPTKNFHDSSYVKPQLPPKFKNFHSSPDLSLCIEDTEGPVRLSKTKNSSTSNGGWFSSKEEEAETERKNEALFSSSSRSSESFSRSSGRKTMKNNGIRDDAGRDFFSFKVSRNSTNTSGKLSRETPKTHRETTQPSRQASTTCLEARKNHVRTADGGIYKCSRNRSQSSARESSVASNDIYYSNFGSFRRKTAQNRLQAANSSRRVERGLSSFSEKKIMNENFQVSGKCSNHHLTESATPTDLYYSDFGSLGRKTTKISRKTSKKGRKKNSISQFEMGTTSIGKVGGSYAVEMSSSDPYSDFRASMVEMIMVEHIFGEEDLGRLLHFFLALNSHCHHEVIIEVFSEVFETLFTY